MSGELDKPRLAAIANRIEQLIVEGEASLPSPRLSSAWFRAHRDLGLAIIAELTDSEGARYRQTGAHDNFLKIARVSCSSTSGKVAVLESWVRKARRLSA